jgi:hypothetical protein
MNSITSHPENLLGDQVVFCSLADLAFLELTRPNRRSSCLGYPSTKVHPSNCLFSAPTTITYAQPFHLRLGVSAVVVLVIFGLFVLAVLGWENRHVENVTRHALMVRYIEDAM